ncbi:MAG: hypothetical protein NWQ54_09160 [Paraglaciecola sp.]|uniref:hypothetical protein n=1 Tax=Alteromonadaceae TaxID=72275 RepID=UPI00273FE0BC|nr:MULTISPECIES: hypothetical protein [Alteromonadaceae]MDP5032368.1 hypothetical protein [Paraglaciecola sp.]MDP5036242.1 hypothetical protein [Alishewanella sp.]MDP5131042.1 hypothetical protein [Paraglaciecola sp.]MDP5458546.1 hypothetical protein [Alishewanella sp. SMS8]
MFRVLLIAFLFLPPTLYAKTSAELSEETKQTQEQASLMMECDVATIGGYCAPQVPQYTQATLSGQTVSLQWVVNSSYDYFLIGQATNSSWGNDDILYNNSQSRFLQAGNSYLFRVAACSNLHGCSDYAYTQTFNITGGSPTGTYIKAPADLTASFSGNTLTVAWGAVSNVSSYRIRQNVNGVWQPEINKGTTRTHNVAISTNNIYSYQVRGCNASAQCSDWSHVLTINTSAAVTYIHTDILGSVIGESNQAGSMLKKTELKPFGERKEQ